MYRFAAAPQTSTAKFAAFFKISEKTVSAVRVNETKITSRNNFIDNLFTLKSEKESKNFKRTLFETNSRFLTWLLTLRPQMPHIYGFLESLSFSHFLALLCHFEIVRLSSSSLGLSFE